MTDLTPEQKSMCDISHLTKRKTIKNDQAELRLQKQIATYLKENYPGVYFISDALGLHTSWGIKQILLQTNSEHKHLDIVILKKSVYGNFCGLVMEVKKESPFINPETLKKNEHAEKQYEVIKMLRLEGFKADFIWTLESAIKMLHGYLGLPIVDNKPLF